MYITNFGRKTMYFLSTVLTIFFQISFGIVDYMNIGIHFKFVPILIICCQVFFLQLGLQTFPNLLSSELFPNDARSRCKGLIRAFSAISSAIMLKLFPYAETHIGKWLFEKYTFKLKSVCRSSWYFLVACINFVRYNPFYLPVCTWGKRCGSEQHRSILCTCTNKVLHGVSTLRFQYPKFLRLLSQNPDDTK